MTTTRALQIHNVLKQLAFVVIGVYLTHSSFTLDEIGVFEMLMFIAMFSSYFWVIGFQKSTLIDYYTSHDKAKYLSNVHTLLFLTTLVICFSLYLFQNWIFIGLNVQINPRVYLYFILYLLFYFPSLFIEINYLISKEGSKLFYYSVFNFFGLISAIVIPVYLEFGILEIVKLLLFLSIIKFSILLLQFRKLSLYFSYNRSYSKQFIINSWPLIMYAAIGGFAIIFDGWLVSWYYGKDIFTIFRYGAKELPLASALAVGLSTSAVLVIGENSEKGLNLIKNESKKIFHILFPIAILLIILSDELFNIFFTEVFMESAKVFKVYLLVIISRLLFPQSILMAKGFSKLLLYVSIVEILLNITLSFVLISYFGVVGVAIATFIAFFFEKLILVYIVSTRLEIEYSNYIPFKEWLVYSILLLFTCLLFF